MTAAQQFGDRSPSYYEYRYSPPVSPKSQPHGYKRKASTQEDELENPSLISSSFKKLRLSKSARNGTVGAHVLSDTSDNAKRSSAVDIAPVGVSYRNVPPSNSSYPNTDSSSHYAPYTDQVEHDRDDFMPIDDTADRVWVHDLDAEIAEIEAEEAREEQRIQLSEAGNQCARIPEHLWKQHSKPDDPASNMQMVLYRDPISISVPEEDDAVRKTILETRRRMQEKQMEHQEKVLPTAPSPDMADSFSRIQPSITPDGDIDMDLD
ncbi:hypothetical protein PMZ80_006653 [Knufia obscura]|uniref:Uncharacterized protein n=2 Tax=Knufia TaxID=430999 RepID=A0AAN8EHN0_9EURO|nr:hypothetical protein PMZ80_006653 [Knufia obscura]KAK5951012.1 hypothetical protein OHC33_008084 [Knufia fluminis]